MIKSTKEKSNNGGFSEDEFDFESRMLTSRAIEEDSENEVSLRPKTLSEYVGQDKVKEKLIISIEAAKMRGECLDHILLHGPPGLGKTTLSTIIAARNGRKHKNNVGSCH